MMTEEILVSELDPTLKFEICAQPGGERFKRCFSCGTCTATCPVSEIDPEYNPRKIIRQVLLGMREEVLSSKVIWFCVRCYACSQKCPQDVKFADIMGGLRDMAVREGYAPREWAEGVEEIDHLSQRVRHHLMETLFEGREPLERKKALLEKEIGA
ncbi:MAG: 4Fe-4S dicluster domain-containing protein [Candidatus Latescibacterota bacterium]